MNLVNLGCGSCFHPDWINIDKYAFCPGQISHDIRDNLPFEDGTVDAVYHSHLIEHLAPEDAAKLTVEICRILKPGGLLRVVTPDLEQIAGIYLTKLHDVIAGKALAEEEYRWMLLELLDQTVREKRGGEMGRFLRRPDLKIKDFIKSRIGAEAENYWNGNLPNPSFWESLRNVHPKLLVQHARNLVAKALVRGIAGRDVAEAFETGLFRHSGEIHLWLYDRYSLGKLMTDAGFVDVRVCRADESSIPDFGTYGLDVVDGVERKPDSLFIEARKS